MDGELEPRRGHRASPACHRETTQSCGGQRFHNVTNRVHLTCTPGSAGAPGSNPWSDPACAKKLGKGESYQNVKPFIETLRVTKPVRQSRASSRKRVLRGGGRPSPRSVDSEIKRCVIEPRNFLVVSLRLGQSRGPRQALATLGPISVPGHTGVGGTLANDPTGFTGTWETLPSPS